MCRPVLTVVAVPSGNTMQVFAGHTAPVACGDFTPDGKRIITADAEGTLIFWDPRSPSPVFKLTPTDARFALDGITSLAVNPASTLAVVGGASGGVRVISLSKGEVVGALAGHQDGESVEAVEFVELGPLSGTAPAASGGVVVTGGTDGKACIWDLSTMRLRATLEHEVRFSVFHHGCVADRWYLFAGCGDLAAPSSSAKRIPHRLCIGGQDAADVGCSYGDAGAGAQGSQWTCTSCSARPWWRCHCQRRRRGCVSSVPDRVKCTA